jgi:FkbM family methyltransferase
LNLRPSLRGSHDTLIGGFASARASIRRLRVYYKTVGLFYQVFTNYLRALWFPFFGAGRFIVRAGKLQLDVPQKFWTMLPTAARLSLLGARAHWNDDHVRVSYNGLELISPPLSKMIALSLKEIFVHDVYRLRESNLSGKVVLDVGAYVGDSSIAFALRGATVHAFEPEPRCHSYLRENVRLNRLDHKVHVHTVGLSYKDETIDEAGVTGANGPIFMVDARAYLRRHGIDRVDLLKLDCEGCEYDLFRPDSYLLQLRPQQIVMEYHRGGQNLCDLLNDLGYSVDWPRPEDSVGYLYARLNGR